jgi:hypothetical protein
VLTTDAPVYATPLRSGVRITLENGMAYPIRVIRWEVSAEGRTVYVSSVPIALTSGMTSTWNWDGRTVDGRLAEEGTYTLKVGPVKYLTDRVTLERTVAFAPGGRIARGFFPLAVENAWAFQIQYSQGETWVEAMRVVGTHGAVRDIPLWYRVGNILDTRMSLAPRGSRYPALVGWPDRRGYPSDLFRFRRPLGYEYSVNFGTSLHQGRLRVGAVAEDVSTPAGAFRECYRLDVARARRSETRYHSFWFKEGIGLVRFTRTVRGYSQTHVLHHASLQGASSRIYRFGLD